MILDKYRIRFEKNLSWRISAFLLDTLGFPLKFLKRTYKINNPGKILIIRKDEIGDIILSTPLFEALKKKYPKTEISVLTSNLTAEVLKNNPHIDRIIIKRLKANGKIDFFKTIKELKKENFEIGIDPKGSIINILLMYFAGIPRRISYWNVSGGRYLLTDPIFYSKQVHETEANLRIAEVLGIKKEPVMPRIYLTDKEKKEVKEFVKKQKLNNFILVYSIPSKKCKEWPFERFKSLVELFPKQKFLFIGRGKDRDIIEKIITGKQNCYTLLDYNLRKISHLAGLATAAVCVDGGPMHLSWISNKKIIALFGQNDIELWKPLRGIVISYIPESKQALNREPLNLNKENKYMKMITVNEVAEKIRLILK